MPIKKHESTTQPGLFFWAALNEIDRKTYCVISQAKGFPPTEGWDDWFANERDADDIAQQLAKGVL